MNLSDIVYGPWAVTQEMHSEIISIYERHSRGESSVFSAMMGKRDTIGDDADRYDVIGGVAVLPLIGVVAKRMNLFTQISGGVSTELFSRDFSEALSRDDVDAIVLHIDSPGGAVFGTPELAELIFSSRGIKPIITYSDGLMASAGIWIGAAADNVYISSEVVDTGSIGVVATHVDVSKREKKAGVKTTEITAGKYKRISSQFSPLSEDGRKDIQSSIDYIYSIFVNFIAKSRSMSVEDVLSRAADGRSFIGSQGIDAGIVDGIMTFDEVLKEAGRRAAGQKNNFRIGRTGEVGMNKEELKVKHPEVFQEISAEAAANAIKGLTVGQVYDSCPGVIDDLTKKIVSGMTVSEVKAKMPDVANAIKNEGMAEGAAGELARVASVRSQLIPGHEALIDRLAADGKSTGTDAALAIIMEEKALRNGALGKIVSGANGPVSPVDTPLSGKMSATVEEYGAMSKEQRDAFHAAGGEIHKK